MRLSRLALATALACALPAAASAAITFVPTAGGAFKVAGAATDLSGLTGPTDNRLGAFGSDLIYDHGSDTYYGVTDRGPGGGVYSYNPRIQAFKLAIDGGTGQINGFTLQSTTLLKRANGDLFNGQNPTALNGNPAILGNSFDSEGLVRRANGNFLISDEYGPSIYEFKADGTFVRAFNQPANISPKVGTTPNYTDGRGIITTGRQDNRGYEGITLSRNGEFAFAILQDPLVEEGRGGQGRRSRNLRIVKFDVASGNAVGQFIYQLEDRADLNARISATSATDFEENDQGRAIGASSITQLADGTFLVIERDNRGLGEVDPTGTGLPVASKRVYRIDLAGATDVSNISLAGSSNLPGGVVPVQKSLYLDVQAAVGNANVTEKLEGLTFGKSLDDGALSLILISDNDMSVTQGDNPDRKDVCTSGFGGTFTLVTIGAGCTGNEALIPTSIYSFKVTGAQAVGAVPEPATWAMMIAGFGLAGAAVRRCKAVALA